MISIEYVEWTEIEVHDCECCGTYSGEGTDVSVNGNIIWSYEEDGHMWASQTNGDFKEILIKEVIEELNHFPEENSYWIEDGWLEKELHNVVVPDSIRNAIEVLAAWMRYYELEVDVCFDYEKH